MRVKLAASQWFHEDSRPVMFTGETGYTCGGTGNKIKLIQVTSTSNKRVATNNQIISKVGARFINFPPKTFYIFLRTKLFCSCILTYKGAFQVQVMVGLMAYMLFKQRYSCNNSLIFFSIVSEVEKNAFSSGASYGAAGAGRAEMKSGV